MGEQQVMDKPQNAQCERAEETLRRQRDELAARSNILSATLRTTDLDELLGLILDEVVALLGMEFAGIHLVHGDQVVLRAWRGLSAAFRAQVLSFPATDPPDWMREFRVVHEHLNDGGVTPEFAKSEGIQAWASVPLRLPSKDGGGGGWLGALTVGSRRYEALNEDDVRALRAMSDQLALAIDHTRTFRQAQERLARLQALHEVDKGIIQRMNPRDILDVVLERVPKKLGADAVAISLLDEEQLHPQVFVMHLPNGTFVEEEAFELANSLLHWLVERQEPVVIYDLTRDPRVEVHRERIRNGRLISYLGVPLVVHGRTIGILHIMATQPRVFADEDVWFFRTMAGQAAIAIENARLYEAVKQELAERIEAQEALEQLSRQNELILNSVGEGIYGVDLQGNTTFVNPAALSMTGYEAEELIGKHQHDLLHHSKPDMTPYPREESPIYKVLKDGTTHRITDEVFWRKDGTSFPVEYIVTPMRERGEIVGAVVVFTDITERKRAEEEILRQVETINALYAGAQKLSETLDPLALAEEIAQTCVMIFDARLAWLGRAEPDGRVSVLTHFPAEIEYPHQITVRWDESPEGQGPTGRAIRSGLPVVVENLAEDSQFAPWRETALTEGFCTSVALPLISHGRTLGALNLYSDQPGFFTPERVEVFQTYAHQAAATLENARLFEETRCHAEEVEAAGQVFQSLNATPDIADAFPSMVAVLQAITGCDWVGIALPGERGEEFIMLTLDQPRAELGKGYRGRLADTAAAADLLAGRPHLTPDLATEADFPAEQALYQAGHRSRISLPLVIGEQVIGALNLAWPKPAGYDLRQLPLLRQIASAVALALERSRLLTAEQQRRRELDSLYQLSRQLVATDNLDTVLHTVVRHVVEAVHVTFCRLLILEDDGVFVCRAAHPIRVLDHDLGVGRPDPQPTWLLYRRVLAQAEPEVLHPDDPDLSEEELQALHLDRAQSICLTPLRVGEEDIGLLMLGEARSVLREPFDAEKLDSIAAMADQAASAIRRATLHRQTAQRLRRLDALRTIDMAITSSLDLRLTLEIFLNQVTTQLGIHAAAVLLFDPHSQMLEYAAGQGFRSKTIEQSRLRLGEGNAGRAALERDIIAISDLESEQFAFRIPQFAMEEGFVAYYGVPLIAKGQVVGVLELFQREPLDPDPEWLDFLDMLAGQAAIAIDNTQLFNDLQRSNADLILAYETTLEGWARALELRDYETEGHSQRVTELTVRIARTMGLSEAELVHVRRGALLHDIGKMGVPDSILLKPGPLDDEEWEIMRQHPVHAFKLLSPIAYLRPALDIPYCHHEKWDGSGYPRGLKGEVIPLPARIFAVVDVWDALRSDRPYRKAWPEEKALEHIQEQAGKHFDPRVVEVFLREIGKELNLP